MFCLLKRISVLLLPIMISVSPAIAAENVAGVTSTGGCVSADAAIDLSGIWSGEWVSRSTGHKGPMTAVFTKRCGSSYDVTFKGRFCKLIPFRYSTVLTAVSREDGSVTLSGQKNLGLLFGTFRFNGAAADCRFNASYCSKDDTGVFRLSRSSR